MTKSAMSKTLARRCELSEQTTDAVLKALADELLLQLSLGQRVSVPGVGKFVLMTTAGTVAKPRADIRFTPAPPLIALSASLLSDG